MYIVIETHGGSRYATICTDILGNNLFFETYKEAEKEAEECQEGIVVDLDLDCRIKQAANNLLSAIYTHYGHDIDWDEIKELEELL